MNEYRYKEITVGQTESFTHTVTSESEDKFRSITGDLNPLHKDDEFATEAGKGKFSGHISHGMLTASLLSTMAGMYLPGKYSLIHSIDNISFKAPVYVDDVLTVTGKVISKQDELSLIQLSVVITNADNKIVLKAKVKVVVME